MIDKDINCNESRIPKNLVQVWFDDGSRLTYFSDLPSVKKGDLVTVEGKKENMVGIVEKVLYSFKSPEFEMKWVKSIIDTNVTGNYFCIDDYIVSLDHSLTVEKFFSIYTRTKYNRSLAIGDDYINLDLNDLNNCELFDNALTKIKGQEMFDKDCVSYIYLKDGVGKAVVRSSDKFKWYEIDFRYKNGKLTFMACDCPYFGNCKHEYALLLFLKKYCIKILNEYGSDSFVMCRKACFFYIANLAKGKINLDL